MSSKCSGTISCLHSSQCLVFSPPFSEANCVFCCNFLLSSASTIYIPSSDLNLILIYSFFSRNFIVVMDWDFVLCNSVLHSSAVSHTPYLITTLPSFLVFLLALQVCIVDTTDFAFIAFS